MARNFIAVHAQYIVGSRQSKKSQAQSTTRHKCFPQGEARVADLSYKEVRVLCCIRRGKCALQGGARRQGGECGLQGGI